MLPDHHVTVSFPSDSIGGVSEFDNAMATLAAFRKTIVDAWQGRAVSFTIEEQRQLKDELEEISALLHDLTKSS